jgi:hypothetical protein
MKVFDVNTEASIQLTAKLGKLHKSAFPVAVRGTLNDAAFKTKKLIPKAANSKFTTRQKNLFNSFTTVEKSPNTFDLRKMKSKVGIKNTTTRTDKLTDGLVAQETGGTIKGRKLVPLDSSRTGENRSSKISKMNRFNNFQKKTPRRKINSGPGTKKSRFVRHVMSAAMEGANHVTISEGGKGIMYRIDSVKRLKTRKIKLKIKPIYYFRNTRKSNITKTPFIEPSAKIVTKKIPQLYKIQAERQFKRLLK